MTKRNILLTIAASVAVFGSAGAYALSNRDSKTTNTLSAIEFTKLATSDGSSSSNENPENIIIKDQSKWDEVLDKTKLKEDSDKKTDIDFNKQMAIAVFMGQKTSGGHQIEITGIKSDSKTVYVSVTKNVSGKTCITPAVMTSPYDIVKLDKTDKAVEFISIEVVKECD